jgi:hypothetical protein
MIVRSKEGCGLNNGVCRRDQLLAIFHVLSAFRMRVVETMERAEGFSCLPLLMVSAAYAPLVLTRGLQGVTRMAYSPRLWLMAILTDDERAVK